MASRWLAAAVLAGVLSGSEGITCYVGSGLNTDVLWRPTGSMAGLQALFAPENLVTPPPAPYSGSLVDCESVSASVHSTHCVTYTSGATRSWACSNPSVSSAGTVLNNCTEGVAVSGAVCCNSTASGCNAPSLPVPPWESVAPSARKCWQNPVAASPADAQAQNLAVRATLPFHAGATMKILTDLGIEAKKLAEGNTSAPTRPPLITSLARAAVETCGGDNTTRGATSCVSMVWHNYLGYNISVPVWGCLSLHLSALGIVGGGVELTGVGAGGAVFSEAVVRKYTADAVGMSPPVVPTIPNFTQAQQDSVTSTMATAYGPDLITYTTCDTDECNAAPPPSTSRCFMLNHGALARAASLPALDALAALVSSPQPCAIIAGASDVCVTVKALGQTVMGGCHSTFLQGVGIPDLAGGGIRVDCGPEGAAKGHFYVPSVFLSGFESMMPPGAVEFECCKGDMCNKAAAPSASGVLKRGVEAILVLRGVTELSVFIDRVKMPLEGNMGELAGVPPFHVLTVEVCYQGTCTEMVNGLNPTPRADGRRHNEQDFAVFVHVNESPTEDQSKLITTLNSAEFSASLTERIKAATGIDVAVVVDATTASAGGARTVLDAGSHLSAGLLLPLLASVACLALTVVGWMEA